ncbi:hypothetical protein IQ211_03070 [Xenorhabdus griffiniae]|nr:hypothetical protein [Xenorhabdus griffiniae]
MPPKPNRTPTAIPNRRRTVQAEPVASLRPNRRHRARDSPIRPVESVGVRAGADRGRTARRHQRLRG